MKKLLLILIILFSGFAFADSDDELEESIKETVQSLQVINTDQATEPENLKDKKTHYKPRKLQDSYLTNVMDGMMKNMIKDILKENPLSKMSKGEVRGLVEGYLNNLPIGKTFEKNPGLLDFFIDWLRDKRALPKFVGIINKPQKVKTYSFIVLGIFVASFFLNLFNSKGSLFKKILRKLMIFFGVAIINVSVFYFMFKPNVQPTIDLILKHLHL